MYSDRNGFSDATPIYAVVAKAFESEGSEDPGFDEAFKSGTLAEKIDKLKKLQGGDYILLFLFFTRVFRTLALKMFSETLALRVHPLVQ